MTWFFLRARPVRAGGVIAGLIAAALIVATMVLQALTLSGAQTADQIIGRFDYQLELADTVGIGADGSDLDDAIVAAMRQAGATDPTVSYKEFGMTPDSLPNESFMIEENNWAAQPFPKRIEIREGRLPEEPGEIAVSTALASSLPIGVDVNFLDRAISTRVVGVISDDFARDFRFAIAPTGTWNAMESAEGQKDRFSVSASRTIFWSGGETTNVVHAISDIVAVPGTEGETAAALEQQVNIRGSLEAEGAPYPIEVTLALLTAPLLAGLFGTWSAGRFVNRIRQTMLTIGIARNRTRAAGAGSIVIAIGLGVVAGSVVGIAAGSGIRPLLNGVSDKALGPVTGTAGTLVLILTGALVGAVIGTVVLVRNPTMKRSSGAARKSRGFSLRQIVPALSAILIFIGIFLLQGQSSFDQKFLAALTFGMALVVLTPFALDLFLIRRPRTLQSLFAARRLRADTRLSSLVSIGVGALIVISFGLSTLFYSAVTATNDQTESSVAVNQVQLSSAENFNSGIDELAESVKQFAGLGDPVFTATAGGFTDLGDGATIVVASQSELERLLGRTLTADEGQVLSDGTLRTKDPDVPVVQFETFGGDVVDWQAKTLDRIDPSFRNYDGFITSATADSAAMELENHRATFVDVTSEQFEKVGEAPEALDFDSRLVALYAEPDVIREPLSSTISSLAIAIIAGFLVTFYAASNARALRPTFSGMRAVGIGRPWFTRVLVFQTGSVLIVALIVASIGAAGGVLAMFAVGNVGIAFHVPWLSIGITIIGILVAGTVGTALSVRRLISVERMI